MKSLTTALVLCIFFLPLSAQEINPCGTDEAERKLLEKYPEQRQYIERLDRFTQEYIAAHAGEINAHQRAGTIYTIPVVFHVIHHYGSEYISDEQIYSEVDILNRDFRKLNADTDDIVPEFKDLIADCEIEFKLATFDPWRNPTNGIDRIETLQTYKGNDESKLNPWPRDLYLNVWVTRQIPQPSPNSTILAYAYRPGSVEGTAGLRDGVIMLSYTVGNTGTGSNALSRTLTHEIGHYLNLNHTWGATNNPGVSCGDDGVSDTPVTMGHGSCSPGDLHDATCTPGVIENTQNYMEYSGCQQMFTKKQKEVMHAALNSDVSSRNNIWTDATLHFTGADVSTNRNTAPPIADFNAPVKMTCVGESVSFKDFSWRGPIDSWDWTFSNATPATSTDKNPSVTFNTAGWQRVSLKVKSTLGENEKVLDKYIYVTNDTQAVTNSFSEDFENPQAFADGWIVNNIDHNQTQWQLTGSVRYSGERSLYLNNFDGGFDIDEITSPPYNPASESATTLEFQFSYASKAVTLDDVEDTLGVYYSLNCGRTWTPIYKKFGASLVTGGNYAYPFKPGNASLWRLVSVDLPAPVANASNVRFKFRFSNSGFANDVFIDNINISNAWTSVPNSPRPTAALSVYPVPNSGKFNIEWSSSESSDVRIELFDMMGKNIITLNQAMTSGTNIFPMQPDLPTGIYSISVSNKENRIVKKLTIVK